MILCPVKPTRIYVKVEMKNVLARRWFIGLSDVHTIAGTSLLHSYCHPYKRCHHRIACCSIQTVDVSDMLFRDNQGMIFQRKKGDYHIIFIDDVTWGLTSDNLAEDAIVHS